MEYQTTGKCSVRPKIKVDREYIYTGYAKTLYGTITKGYTVAYPGRRTEHFSRFDLALAFALKVVRDPRLMRLL